MKNINNIITETIKEFLLEYSNEKRLPFEEDEFKNKNYLEQYTDWLEDFGKYGTLPPSKLDFWEELKRAIKYILDNNLHGRFDIGLKGQNEEDIFNDLKSNYFNKYLSFNEDGNVYVERQIVLDEEYSPEKYNVSASDNEDPMTLYNMLVNRYNHNVGGCWSYREGNAKSYCTQNHGTTILFKGYIRCEDINFVKTILLNYYYSDEYEIRVKPNAKIELFEVNVNCKYNIPLRSHLIVSATYFGNNGEYRGKYALVDDGFGNYQYMDRQHNIKDTLDIDEIDYDVIATYNNGFNLVRNLLNGRYSLIDNNGNLIGNGKLWFDYVNDFDNGLAKVILNNKQSFINKDGDLIGNGKLWFDNVEESWNGFIIVKLNNKETFINEKGKLIGNGKLWFDEADNFWNDFAKVKLNNKWSFINTKGQLIGNNQAWFDDVRSFENGFAKVKLNDKQSFIDTSGNLINNGNAWFDKVEDFWNDFAIVNLNNKESFIDKNGNLIGNGKLWFDYVFDFENGFAEVELNNHKYLIDTESKIYDYETEEPIPSPINSIQEKTYFKLNKLIKEELNNYLQNNLL